MSFPKISLIAVIFSFLFLCGCNESDSDDGAAALRAQILGNWTTGDSSDVVTFKIKPANHDSLTDDEYEIFVVTGGHLATYEYGLWTLTGSTLGLQPKVCKADLGLGAIQTVDCHAAYSVKISVASGQLSVTDSSATEVYVKSALK